LFEEFGFEPHSEIDPDLCVTMGAAIQAAMINGQQIDTVLVDVTPYTYGTSAIGTLNGETYPFKFIPVIHKNSVLPNRKTEAFMPSYDGQDIVEVTIFQGEDPDALNNIKIGEFQIEGLQDVSAGNMITLTLDLDLNGILHVSAEEKSTGLEKSITIKNALSKFEGSTLDTAKQRLTSLFGQMDSAMFEEEQPEDATVIEPVAAEIEAAEKIITKAESMFEKVSGEDKEDMIDLIETISSCIETDDIKGLKKPVAELNDIIYYLES
jgi:molecular chaperone DnaK (HSP70)